MKSRSLAVSTLALVCPPFTSKLSRQRPPIPARPEYGVLRNGEPVRQNLVDIKSSGDGLQAQISTNLAVKMALMRALACIVQIKGKDDSSIICAPK